MILHSVKSIQGNRDYMEDRFVYYNDDIYNFGYAFIADGHGGDKTSNLTCSGLGNKFKEYIEYLKIAKNRTYTKVCIDIKNIIEEWAKEISGMKDGSTLTGIFVTPNWLFIYNIGDSRTLFQTKRNTFIYTLTDVYNDKGESVANKMDTHEISSHKIFITNDHDPKNQEETTRVHASGGVIYQERLNGTLAITRALGDSNVGKGLSYNPDVYCIQKNAIYPVVVMYSDGVYEMQYYQQDGSENNISDEHCFEIAWKYGADYLVDYAYDTGSDDNITSMVVHM